MKSWAEWVLATIRLPNTDLSHLGQLISSQYGCDEELGKEIATDVMGLAVRLWAAGESHGWNRERVSTERRSM